MSLGGDHVRGTGGMLRQGDLCGTCVLGQTGGHGHSDGCVVVIITVKMIQNNS